MASDVTSVAPTGKTVAAEEAEDEEALDEDEDEEATEEDEDEEGLDEGEDEEDGDEEGDEDEEEDEEDEAENDSIPLGIDEDSEILVKGSNGREEVIEIPEGLIVDDEQGDDYMTRTYLSGDSTAISPADSTTLATEVYIDRLRRMPTAIEMPWNEVVQKFIDRYSGRLRRTVSVMLGKSNFFMPAFEEALEVYGLPLELKYLPVIESALNPNAVSSVGAGGLWQFMVSTGKRYGLKVNTMIDERRDLVKSSLAAAHYLSDLYEMFGDWNLVIAAYNCGPGNITKAIQRSGGVKDYWQIYPYLPAETRGYVPAFIAANYIMTYYCEHDIVPMETTLPEATDTIMLFRNVHLEQVSKVLGIDIEKLRMLNPQYRRDIVTGYSEPTDLRLPKEYISKYIEMEDSIVAYNVDELMKRDMVEVNKAPVYKAKRVSYKSKRRNALKSKRKGRRSKVSRSRVSSKKRSSASRRRASSGRKSKVSSSKKRSKKATSKKGKSKSKSSKKRRR
ncbi:MAG: lytic transglycosylase domain-containing protein [Prevotella sp.]|nr:lytic transglycosylase domain-containing protein [Prevotella sp.]